MKTIVFSSLIAVSLGMATAMEANAQTNDRPANGVGNQPTYPSGSRVYSNGRISLPNGGNLYPNVAVPRGDGSTTYYYPNGTRITIPKKGINPVGTYLSPSSPNGGLRDYSNPRYRNDRNTIPRR
jgi:hypothetical protein